MSKTVLCELQEHILYITLNRIDKHNAFDDVILNALQSILDEATTNTDVRVIVLKANGRHFSAGADLNWMKKMAGYTEAENLEDARVLAHLMYSLHHFPKPTIAMVQGGAMGGGAGLAAAVDITISSESARFCFSEVKLGLIPAVISPYVIKAIGERASRWLFMSADTIDAIRAKELGLVHYVVSADALHATTHQLAQKIAALSPNAVAGCKSLVHLVAHQPIDEDLIEITSKLIAKQRVSIDGQRGLQAFLNKETPNWD